MHSGLEATAPSAAAVIHEYNGRLRETLLQLLREDGIDSIAVRSAHEVIPHIQRSVNVLVLDLEAPDVDGIALCRQIRETFPRLGILATCTHDKVDLIEKALDAGADHLLVKPFSLIEAKAYIRRQVARTRDWKAA